MTLAEMVCASRGYHVFHRYGVGTGTHESCILWADSVVCATCGCRERVKDEPRMPADGTAYAPYHP